MAKRISRRRFLMLGAMGTASLLIPDLSACIPAKPDAANLITPTPPVPATPTPTPTLFIPASPTPTATEAIRPISCRLSPAVVPTRPAVVPGYTKLDPDTGLHMTGTPVDIDVNSYRLKVTGKINNPLALSYDELRCLPKVTTRSTSICLGNFEDRATWAGVPFSAILDLAGLQPDAERVVMKGADGFIIGTLVTAVQVPEAYLAYEWEGEPVPVLHGFPLRAILASDVGSYRVKWLLEIEVT